MPLQTGTAVAAVLGILLSLALSVIMSYFLCPSASPVQWGH